MTVGAELSNRAQAKLLVSLWPGIHLRKLQKVMGISFSTARYHVDGLERDGEIVRTKDGGYDRLYPAGTSDGMKAVYAVLQSETTRKILRTLEDGGQDVTMSDLSERLRLPKSTLSEHVTALSRVNLVRRSVTQDGRTLLDLNDGEEVARLLATFERNLLSVAAEGFIDLWDL